MEKKVVIMLVATLPLLVVWFFIPNPEQEYSFILFDREFSQQAKWYAYDVSFHLERIILHIIIYMLVRVYLSKVLRTITLVFMIFSIFRLLEYWTFHHTIPMLPFILCLTVFSLGYHFTKK
jgi:hypothetical protein